MPRQKSDSILAIAGIAGYETTDLDKALGEAEKWRGQHDSIRRIFSRAMSARTPSEKLFLERALLMYELRFRQSKEEPYSWLSSIIERIVRVDASINDFLEGGAPPAPLDPEEYLDFERGKARARARAVE